MKLAFGKFDPELNVDLILRPTPLFKVLEVDLSQFFRWKPRTIQLFQKWVQNQELELIARIPLREEADPAEYEEVVKIWSEFFPTETLYFSVFLGKRKWDESARAILTRLPTRPYFFEWSKDDSEVTTSFLSESKNFAGFTVDPHWHHQSLPHLKATSLHFKLHGWAEERWVRRYGKIQGEKIKQSLKAHAHSVLTLSYSGKSDELSVFQTVS